MIIMIRQSVHDAGRSLGQSNRGLRLGRHLSTVGYYILHIYRYNKNDNLMSKKQNYFHKTTH